VTLGLESDHPYVNDLDRTFDVTAPAGTASLRIHFARIDLEEGYDFLEVLDGSGARIHRYTGDHVDVMTDEMAGATATVRLVSDYSITRWGFSIDRIEVATGGAAPADWTAESVDVQSAHPYADHTDASFDLAAPAGATEVRVHFDRIEVEAGYDFVEVYDGAGTLVERYDGTLSDVTTRAMTGATARVRLVTDSSVTAWGFHVDRIEHR
jgi:hypothetical protein